MKKIPLIIFLLLVQLISAQNSDTSAIRKELNIAGDSLRSGNGAFAKKTADALLIRAAKINNDFLLARCYLLLGKYFESRQLNDSGIYYSNLAIKHFAKTPHRKYLGQAYHNAGTMHYRIADYPNALNSFLQAIKIREEIKDSIGIAWSEMNIGNIYYFQKAWDDALTHYQKAKDWFLKTGYKEGLGVVTGNIALIYGEKRDFENAGKAYEEAIRINTETGRIDVVAQNLNNLGSMYHYLKQYDKSRETYERALKANLEANNPYSLSLCYSGFAALAADRKDYKAAEDYIRKGIALNDQTGDRQLNVMAYKNLSDIYFLTKRYKEAYEWLSRHKSLSDSVTLGDKLAEAEAKFGKEKQEREIALLKQANQIGELELKRKQITLYAASAIGVLLLVLGVFLFRNYRQKKKANLELEFKNREINHQKNVIETKQKEVLDSINYAQKIQRTLTGSEDLLKEHIKNHFIFFKPKDIVSGDFFFTAVKHNRFYLAVCDSTGHGVPGAFMSLLNSNFLNEAINEKEIKEPHEIFNYVRERLIKSVSKDGSQDGMDGILFCFELGNNGAIERSCYAAANSHPLLISGKQSQILPTDKMPVGKGMKTDTFTLYDIDLNIGDTLYLYTDGMADQFGGPKGKKFKYRQLAELLKNISSLSPKEQLKLVTQNFDNWRGSLEQVDDICLIGLIF